MEPNEAFFALCGGRNQRFIVELRLFKNMVHLKRKNEESCENGQSSQSVNQQSLPATQDSQSMSQSESLTPISTASSSGPNIFSSNGDQYDPTYTSPSKRQRTIPKIVPKSVKHYMEQQQQQQQSAFQQHGAAPSSPLAPTSSSASFSSSSPPGTPLSSSFGEESQVEKALKLEFEDLLHSENNRYFVLHTTDNDEFKEFVENDVPVVTYSFTEDIVAGKWYLNLIWPTEKRPLSWRGRFCFHLSVFRRDGFHVYNHIMSKISSQFSIFSKPDVYLKKIGRSTSKLSNSSPSPNAKLPRAINGGADNRRTRNAQSTSSMQSLDKVLTNNYILSVAEDMTSSSKAADYVPIAKPPFPVASIGLNSLFLASNDRKNDNNKKQNNEAVSTNNSTSTDLSVNRVIS
jgi:hypothetical protein